MEQQPVHPHEHDRPHPEGHAGAEHEGRGPAFRDVPPWMRGRRFGRRRARMLMPFVLVVALALALRRGASSRRTMNGVFIVFRPTTVIDVSFGARGGRSRRRGLARLLGSRRR